MELWKCLEHGVHHGDHANSGWNVDNLHSMFGAWFWCKIKHCSSLKVTVLIGLLVIPIWICCTRITDYFHHYSDVIGGAGIGIMVSSMVFMIFHSELYAMHKFRNKWARESLLSCNITDECQSAERRIMM